MQYLIFEGVRDIQRIVNILLKITDLDIQIAPKLIAITLNDESPDLFLNNPQLQELEDTPEGFWSMDVCDRSYLYDRIEEAYRKNGKRLKKHS